MNYYVGDPCYVIEEWDEFCSKLFAKYDQLKTDWLGRNPEREYAPGWVTNDVTLEWKGHRINVCGSPFGDGCWKFHESAERMPGWISGKQMGVDAGLLAVVPEEVITKPNGMDDGIMFSDMPFLETGESVTGYVQLNQEHTDMVWMCGECGEYHNEQDEYYCDDCWTEGCHSCWGGCEC